MKKLFGLALVAAFALSLPVVAAEKSGMTKTETMTTQQQYSVKPGMPQTQTYQQRSETTTTSQSAQTRAATPMTSSSQELLTYDSPAQKQYVRGQALLVDKRYAEAIQSFEQAISTSPDFTLARQGLAKAYFLRGEFEPALQQVQKAMETDPLYNQLILDKAMILDAQRKDAQALESYLTFLSLEPQDSSRVDIQRRANDLYDKWETRLDANQKAYFQGLRAVATGNPATAITELKTFIASSATPTEQVINAHRLLGVAYQEVSRPSEAIAVWEVITKQQPQNATAYYHLGSTYEQAGRQDQAKEAWSNYMKYAPKSQAYIIERPLILVQPTTGKTTR